MNRIFTIFCALALVGAVSCSKEEPGIRGLDSEEKNLELESGMIGFTVAGETKTVTVSDISTLQTNGFKAIVLKDVSGTKSEYIAASNLTWNSSYFVYASHHYYPDSGTLYAYAIYPNTYTPAVTAAWVPYVRVTSTATDILYAAQSQAATTHSAIPLAFGHPLARVKFNVSAPDSDVDYYVDNIKINVNTAADLNLSTGTFGQVTTASTSDDVVHSSTSTKLTYGSGTLIGDGLYIPAATSTSPAGNKVTIVWSVKNKSDNSLIKTVTKHGYVSLTAGSLNTINVTLSAPGGDDEIKFSASVTAWTSGSQSMSFVD